jgi:hypothetical protein
MQNNLKNVLQESDRLENGSVNESEGGEECEAILTSIRRAKRRAARRSAKLLEQANGDRVIDDNVEITVGEGKPLPNLRLTFNGH